MKKLIKLCCACILSGVMASHYEVNTKATEYTNFNFIGVPTVLGVGFSGSSTPITKSTSLTNKHVSTMLLKRTVKVSSKCDAVTIPQDNSTESLPNMNYAKIGDELTVYGYSGLTTLPVSSTGKIVSHVYKDGCHLMRTTAGGVAGMSGGAVLNKDNEIVGIVMGVDTKHWTMMIVPVQSMMDLLPLDKVDEIKHKNK